MELQALLVLCGVGVTGVAVLLLMGLFSASGTSYEEAIAQQRRATSELLALADNKNKSKKTSKKANKKLAKKEKKDNTTAATGSEPESEPPTESGMEDEPVPPKPHVEFSSSIVVEVPTDNPPNINVKIRKRGKDPKIKPILINKEDPSCVSDPSAAATPIAEVSNHFEEMHPKDEFELLQSSLEKVADKKEEKKEETVEKKEGKASKQSKGAKATLKQSLLESAKEEPAPEKQSSNEATLEQRRVKKGEKKVVAEMVEVAEEVVPPLNAPQPSELTTDKLLRQALPPAPAPAPAPAPSPPAKSKKKKTDQDMLALMGGEGGGVAVSELVRVVRQATLSRDEIQVLTDALLNKHHDPLPAHSEWTEGPNDPMQKLKKQLADKEKALADELEASKAVKAKVQELRASLNAERAGAAAARAELHTQQTRLQRLLEEHRTLMQEKNTLIQQISESEAQVSRMQNMELLIQRFTETEVALRAELAARALEAAQARDDAMLAHQHAADLAQQLQEANLAIADVEQQRQFAVHAEQLAQQDLRQTQARLAGLSELQNELQRLTARAQAAESSAEKLKEDMEKQKEELLKEIKSLQEQLAGRDTELAELKQLKAAPAQNGLPPTSVIDEQKAAELAKVESTLEALRGELLSAQHSVAEQRRQVAALQDQLALYKDKNNEAAVKAQEQHLAEVANVLRAVCPTAAPNSSIGQEWLHAFAENLKKELWKKETEKQQVEKDLASKLLEKENERKQIEAELQKKLQEKELAAKEIERKLQQQMQDNELASKKIESELLKKLQDELAAKKQSEIELQKKLQEELAAKEIERKLQQQMQDKELASNKIESELLKKLQDELAAKKQSEIELQKKLQDELRIKKKLESELQKKEVVKVHVQQPVLDDSRVKDLEVKNVQLQSQVDKYKRIIDDTENVLSRLQLNVSREEARWQQQLSDKQRDLEALRQHTVQQMQNKIDSLKAELEQLQSRNHSDSFADAERIAEENLMAGCAANHDTEIHNGPLQEQIKLNEI